MDYKGWFRVGDGTRCDPLTINHAYSRASLVCRAMVSPKTSDVKQRLEEAFWKYGLPRAILSDNGTPFASSGIGGLSRLSVWLLRLGVRSLRIEPGKPEQNCKHRRFAPRSISSSSTRMAGDSVSVRRRSVIYVPGQKCYPCAGLHR